MDSGQLDTFVENTTVFSEDWPRNTDKRVQKRKSSKIILKDFSWDLVERYVSLFLNKFTYLSFRLFKG